MVLDLVVEFKNRITIGLSQITQIVVKVILTFNFGCLNRKSKFFVVKISTVFVFVFKWSALLSAVLHWCSLCVSYCAESDTAAVYSTVEIEDVSYGQMIIKEKKNRSKTRGTAALLSPSLFSSVDRNWGFE